MALPGGVYVLNAFVNAVTLVARRGEKLLVNTDALKVSTKAGPIQHGR